MGLEGQLGLEPYFLSGDYKRLLQAYKAIRQRIDMNIVLGRLDRAGTGKYIAAHLAYSGTGQELSTRGAEDGIYKISVVIRRMVNCICEKTLTYAYQQQKRLADEHMVRCRGRPWDAGRCGMKAGLAGSRLGMPRAIVQDSSTIPCRARFGSTQSFQAITAAGTGQR